MCVKKFGSVEENYPKDEKHDQSRGCKICNLVDGRWRTSDYKMNLPRIKSWIFYTGHKATVVIGATSISNINNENGCRKNQEGNNLYKTINLHVIYCLFLVSHTFEIVHSPQPSYPQDLLSTT